MQLEFVWRDEHTLRGELEERLGIPIHLTLTDNTSTVMTVNHGKMGQATRVRLHKMFLSASPQVIRALTTWVNRPGARASGNLLDSFIQKNLHQLRRRPKRRARLRTQGTCYDLQRLFDEVNHQEFAGRVDAGITWGRMPSSRRRRRSIRFGSYDEQMSLIRIHPLLDDRSVPEYFVRYIVFHEMLHADLGIDESPSGRRRMHTPEFNRRENEYRDYDRAVAWQNKSSNLARLLARRR